MLFHMINKPIWKIVFIKNNVMDIERVDNFKYLGIYLDEILQWNVEYVCKSLLNSLESSIILNVKLTKNYQDKLIMLLYIPK